MARLLWLLLLLWVYPAQAAITYAASATAQGNDDLGSLTLPASVQANDVVLVQVTIRDRTSSDDSITAPTGWTLIGSQVRDNDVLQSLYYRVASSADASASYTWDFEGAGNRRFILGGQVFRGVDTTTPVHVVSSNTMSSSTSITASSVTTTLADTMLAAFYSVDAGNRTMTPTTGMTEAYDVEEDNTANGLSVMGSYESWSTIGASGGRTASISVSSDDGIAHLLALAPGAMPPTISSVSGDCSNLRRVVIVFSEDVSASTATNTANYTVTNPAGVAQSVLSAVRSPNNTVTLTLAADLNDLTAYTVSISNVQDLDGNTIVAASSSSFSLSCELNCFTDTFPGPGSLSDDWAVDNSSGSYGNPRIITDQRMRLTDASGNVATVANLLLQFPAANNRIDVEFDYYAYNGSGADGVAVTFSDATVTPVPGGYGGSLGYAQRSGINGFAGGWLGVGIDEYGNFSNPTEGRASYAGSGAATNQGFYVDSVSVRGSGSGTSGYPFLRGTGTLSPGVDQGGATPAPGHRYRITLDHTAGGGTAYVTVARDTGSGYATIIPSFNVYSANPSQAAVPENWVVSLTGSTGGATNIHEIADLKICAAVPFDTYSLVDHYHISHSGNGITCEAEPVTITAHDASHNPVNVTSDTSLTVTTNPAVTSIVSSPVTIAAGSSSTTVNIQQTSPESTIDIDVVDGSGKTEVDGGGDHDPTLAFADTGLRFYADGIYNDIDHQLMSKPSDTGFGAQTLTLRALRTNDATMACEAAVSGVHNVDFGFACLNPETCSASGTLDVVGNSSVSVAGSNGAAAVTATVPMTFDASGVATFSFDANDTGRMQLLASLTVTPAAPDPEFTLTGYSNTFAVRPFGFDIDFPPYDPDDPLYQRAADFADDGLLNNSTELDPIDPFDGNLSWARNANGSVFTQAGVAFTTRLRAVGWEAEDDEDENGEPDLDDRTTVADETANLTDNSPALSFAPDLGEQNVELSHDLILPPPPPTDLGVLGTLDGSTTLSNALFVNGVATLQPSWSEVGIIDLTASLEGYLGVSGLNITGTAQNVGRFRPARFEVSPILGAFEDWCGTAPDSFTYIGQGFNYASVPGVIVRALNADGGETLNYTSGAFQKLSDVHVHRDCPGDTVPATNGVHIVYPCMDDNPPNLSVQPFTDADGDLVFDSGEASNSTTAFSSASNGVMTFDFNSADTFLYTKNAASRVRPFDSELYFEVERVVDSDGVIAADVAQVPPDVDDPLGEPLRFKPSVTPKMRYGRWIMENAFGPELMPLAMTAQSQFLDDDGNFVLNMLDNCTALGTVATTSGSATSGQAIAVGGGTSTFTYNSTLALGAGGFNFTAPGSGYTGTIPLTVNLNAVPWLRFDWDSDGDLEDHPGARATFGQYRGHDRIIYWREVEN